MMFEEMRRFERLSFWQGAFVDALNRILEIESDALTDGNYVFRPEVANALVNAAEYVADRALDRLTLKRKELLNAPSESENIAGSPV